jgi:hypothetical protein
MVSVDRLESRDAPGAVAFSNPVASTQVVIRDDAERNEVHRAVRDMSTAAVIHDVEDPNT